LLVENNVHTKRYQTVPGIPAWVPGTPYLPGNSTGSWGIKVPVYTEHIIHLEV